MSTGERPASIVDDLQRHPITSILMIGAIAGFLACESGRNVDHLMLLPGTALLEPWRFFTSLLPHFVPAQFAFNMVWMWIYGRKLEERMGTKPFAILTAAAAVVSGGIESAFFSGPIGLSGVVFAYVFYAFARARTHPEDEDLIARDHVQFMVFWLFASVFMGWTGMLPVSNGAHLGGLAVGLALGSGRGWVPPYLVAVSAGAIAFAQPSVAVLKSDVWVLRQLADRALESSDYETAVLRYGESIDAGDRLPSTFDRYGIALGELGREDEKYEAWNRALELRPTYFDVETILEIQEHREAPRGDG